VLLDVAQLRRRRSIHDKPSGYLRFAALATKPGEICGLARGEAFGFAIREELTRPGRVHAGRVHHKGPGENVGSSRHYLGGCLGGRMGPATRDLQ